MRRSRTEEKRGMVMVKGTKRQIFFLPDLQSSGRGLFECACFVLRSDGGDADADENEMLLEAEKIVAEAERLRGRNVPAPRAGAAADRRKKTAQKCRRGRGLAFVLGMSAGVAVALMAYLAWHMLCA